MSQNDPAHRGPFYTPRNVSREEAMPAGIRRVLLLPVSVGEVAPVETAKTLDRAMVVALQNEQRFEVVVFTREECSWAFGREEFSSVDALPHGFLEKLAATYAVDAVIFVDLTAYQAYRPQAIGLRSKLATVRDVRLVWSFDEIISATDPAVANSVRRQYLKNDRGTQPLDLSPAALQSPSRFAAFAAQAMFRTLPPR
ncbi:MAG: hypothetical protein Q8J74_04525 [Candidatus Didemnitutus sp.]|nr:hypothetical protein [Candidatus Didemnitutus sp.]